MHDYIIEAMVEALKPTLKNPAKAKQILDRFWSDKMALVWDVQDVHTAANEREVALTKQGGHQGSPGTAPLPQQAVRHQMGGRDLLHRGIRSGPQTHEGRGEAVCRKEHPHHRPEAPISHQPTQLEGRIHSNWARLAPFRGSHFPDDFCSESNIPSLDGFLSITGPGSPNRLVRQPD